MILEDIAAPQPKVGQVYVHQTLLKMIGAAQSVILCNLARLCLANQNELSLQSNSYYKGYWWVKDALTKIHADFPDISMGEIEIICDELEIEFNIIGSTTDLNDSESDQTKWYTVRPDILKKWHEVWIAHGRPIRFPDQFYDG